MSFGRLGSLGSGFGRLGASPKGGVRGPSIRLSGTTISDTASIGDVVGTLSVSGGTGSETFTLTDDAGGLFSISGTSLEVAGSLTIGAYSITVQSNTGLTRSFTITVTARVDLSLQVAAGVFVLTGIAPALAASVATTDYSLTCSTGTFATTGGDMMPVVSYTMSVDAGSITLTGIDALLSSTAQKTLSADTGTFSLTGVAATLTNATSSSSKIKHIEQGSITLSDGSLTGTWNPGSSYSFDPDKTILVWNGIRTDTASSVLDVRFATRIAVTDGTTITATRENTTDNCTVAFTIVEFASGVNSIQSGTITVAATGTSGTATISAVGSTAFVLYLGVSGTGSIGLTITAGVELTNSTTVTGHVASRSGTQTIDFMVVDLDSTIVTAVQQQHASMASTSTSNTDTLSSVTTGLTALMYGGFNYTAAGFTSANMYMAALTNGTTVTKTRVGTNATAKTCYYTAVTFASGALSSNGVQRTTSPVVLSSSTTGTATITSVNRAKAFVNFCGWNAANANANLVMPTLELTDDDTVTASVASAGSPSVGFEVVEFA